MVLILLTSPANVEAAQLYKENIKEYERKVKVSVPLIFPYQLPSRIAARKVRLTLTLPEYRRAVMDGQYGYDRGTLSNSIRLSNEGCSDTGGIIPSILLQTATRLSIHV